MKHLLVFLFLLCAANVSAQDVIVKKDGSTIVCRVVELTDTEITYKKWSDLNGSNYVMERSAASAINYENGKKVNLSEATNLDQPNNQNDGMQQYNDRALRAMDAASNKKVKKLKMTAWIGGAVLAVGGITTFAAGGGVSENNIVGACLGIGAVAWTTAFLVAAHNAQNKIEIQSVSLYQYEWKLKNGKTLTAESNMLKDNLTMQHTIGLGLRYNF